MRFRRGSEEPGTPDKGRRQGTYDGGRKQVVRHVEIVAAPPEDRRRREVPPRPAEDGLGAVAEGEGHPLILG